MRTFYITILLYIYMGHKPISENEFRDTLVLQIIEKYGREKRQQTTPDRPSASSCRVRHRSALFPVKERCQYCKLQGKVAWTKRKCPDCLFEPALCQTTKRNCHSLWHEACFDQVRNLWFSKKQRSVSRSADYSSSRGRGRPKGAKNKKKRRGKYRSQK